MAYLPSTTDETQRLELAYLRRSGLLRPGRHTTTLEWSCRGEPIGSISLQTHLMPDNNYLRLQYTANGKTEHNYQVKLEAIPSNLPGVAGHRYYMICPQTGYRATVLYLSSSASVFAHRLAYGPTRLYYDSQLEPKRLWGLSKEFSVDRAWEKEYRKGRKTHYRGKPTRWYARLLKLEQQIATLALT